MLFSVDNDTVNMYIPMVTIKQKNNNNTLPILEIRKSKHLVPTNIVIKIIEYYKHLFDDNFDKEKKYAIA